MHLYIILYTANEIDFNHIMFVFVILSLLNKIPVHPIFLLLVFQFIANSEKANVALVIIIKTTPFNWHTEIAVPTVKFVKDE